MARPVDPNDVFPLIPGTSLTDLTPFIEAANQLTNKLAGSFCGSDLTEEELETIEKWLVAAYASVSDPSLNKTSEKVEGAAVTVSRGNTSSMSGILSTQYGQMANDLSCGCLGQILKAPARVCFFG